MVCAGARMSTREERREQPEVLRVVPMVPEHRPRSGGMEDEEGDDLGDCTDALLESLVVSAEEALLLATLGVRTPDLEHAVRSFRDRACGLRDVLSVKVRTTKTNSYDLHSRQSTFKVLERKHVDDNENDENTPKGHQKCVVRKSAFFGGSRESGTTDDATIRTLEDDWFTIALYVCIGWQDDSLVWDKEDYGGVEHISVSQSEAWFPDITAINTNPDNYVVERDTADLGHNGKLWDCHPARIKVPCVMDLTYYPHDRHVCSVRFSSSTYLESEVRTIGILFYYPEELSSEWNAKSQAPLYGVTFKRSYVDIVFEMSRRAGHHLYTVTLPWAAAVVLTLLGFWMSIDSDSRLWLACVNLFLLVVMLGRMGTLLDRSASVPKIVFFLGNTVVIQAMVAILVIFMLNMASTPVKIPERIVRFLAGPIGGLLCLNRDCFWANQPQLRSENEVLLRRQGEEEEKRNCLLLAQALDRATIICCFRHGGS
ncbi:hypothetical protein HPB47_000329 [Ixodes persulcatus]|uniref:Uncharacterized protein n=1 Tax=Ixodes persulcatus TaxID=34615 RepID=A0AC60PTM1_IXOPE|nr:hypothetical protein HPB47_000329 [Ixodes persulcatus]